MKKLIFASLLVIFLLSLGAPRVIPSRDGNLLLDRKKRVEVTVTYERQSGRGSNQYAVWIENEQGKLIRTLFVTRFTANGGYSVRPDCTPTWVNKASPSTLSQQQVDAFSGATPASGKHVCMWDLTDESGKIVPPGNYNFLVEGTLLMQSRVLFKGTISITNQKTTRKAVPEYTSDGSTRKNMISAVEATYYPE
ncbi:MAG: DUF2271 domain-containing protein [Bacteroidales bacterium]|jgi:hypothetical protein|nr:DUF2271 domain-containing protein [Bacteroidales bacterium]